jgi:hypothetical protein
MGPPVLSATNLRSIALEPASLGKVQIEVSNDSEEPSDDSRTPGEQPGDSQLYGMYVGQIDARIERAWQRPRTPIGAREFNCRVKIDQDADGSVERVTLQACNGDERWQESLIQAIESASPLPAPPDPKVFARSLDLSFHGEPYTEGSPGDLYEPETPAVLATIDRQQAATALEHFNSALHTNTGGVIDLRIVGYPDGMVRPALEPANDPPDSGPPTNPSQPPSQ